MGRGPTGVLAFTLQGEDTHDWETGEWWAPINFLVAKIVKIDGQSVRIVGGVRYWIELSRQRPAWLWRWARNDIPISDALIERATGMGFASRCYLSFPDGTVIELRVWISDFNAADARCQKRTSPSSFAASALCQKRT